MASGNYASTSQTTASWPVAFRRISWGAIIAGVVVALILHFVLSLLGLGIGLTTVDPASGDSPSPQALSIGAAIWYVIVGLISLFIGGWIAGRLAGMPRKLDAALHGLITWATMGVLTLFLLSTAVGGILGGAMGVVRDNVNLNAHQGRPQVSMGGETYDLYGYAGGGAATQPAGQGGGAMNDPQNRQRAEQAADALSSAALWAAIASILGAAAATFGGMSARPDDMRAAVTTTDVDRA